MGRLPAKQKVERDDAIVADRARGLSWRVVAERNDCSTDTAKRAWRAFYEAEKDTIPGRDPMDVIFELIQGYDAWGEQLAEVADTTNESAKIGAIKAQMDCAVRKTELLQATGLLPKQLGKLRVEMDIRYMTTQILAIFDKYGMPVDAQKELVEVLEHSTPSPN